MSFVKKSAVLMIIYFSVVGCENNASVVQEEEMSNKSASSVSSNVGSRSSAHSPDRVTVPPNYSDSSNQDNSIKPMHVPPAIIGSGPSGAAGGAAPNNNISVPPPASVANPGTSPIANRPAPSPSNGAGGSSTDNGNLLSKLTVNPAVNAVQVLTDQSISASFVQVPDFARIEIDTFSVTNSGLSVDGLSSTTGDTAIFTPSRSLEYNTVYYVSLSGRVFKNSAAVEAVSYEWSFTTIDPQSTNTVLYTDFNSEPAGIYTERDLSEKWNAFSSAGVAQGRVSIVPRDDGRPGNVMRVRYQAGRFGLGAGGVQWKTNIGSHEELYIVYWVKFANNFDFVRGGKMPGLAGGEANTGGAKPSGRDGWSARMMWRPLGKAVQYIYYPDQPNADGEDFDWNLQGQQLFNPGQWHRVETRIKMNTPGQRNGIVQSWFDGKLSLDRRQVRFRDTNTFAINWFLFSTFFGGSDQTWAPKKFEYAYFDNFIISKKPIYGSMAY